MKKTTFILLVILVIIINSAITEYLIEKSSNKEMQIPAQLVQDVAQDEFSHQDSNAINYYPHKQTIQSTDIFTRDNSITKAVRNVAPSVVSINVVKTEIVTSYDFFGPRSFFFDFFPRQYRQKVKSIGSGVIIDKDGYIITNAHVVKNATEIKVILPDSREFEGKIIGIDDLNDIAVLKIDGKSLPYATLGNSDDLIIGEWAIAFGNPFAFLIKNAEPSVTLGVISAVNRNFQMSDQGKIYKKMIQTDAAINPGNSGGPLTNINGELIGINTFIFTQSGGSEGIGFAIPINRVKKIANELSTYGKIRSVWFGFKVQDISKILAINLHLKSTNGVLVSYVEKSSPAQEAGLKKGDVIIKINDIDIKSTDDAEMAVSDIRVNETIKIVILRHNKQKTIYLTTKEHF